MDYEQVIEKLKRWATADDRIRALVLTGSGATGATHPLSDRDIEVVTTAVEELLDDESWWMELGEVLVVERLENADGNPTRLAYYVGERSTSLFLLLTSWGRARTTGLPYFSWIKMGLQLISTTRHPSGSILGRMRSKNQFTGLMLPR